MGGEKSGAIARTTAAGRVRFTAPVDAGVVQVEYVVGDGVGAPVTEKLAIRVQDKLATESFAAVAEPDIVSGETGRPITIRPLGNDLPGTDPLTPEAALELAGKVASVGGADVRTDLVEGTITFRSRTARTFLLDYDAAYGSAPIAAGRIRVDVREPARKPPDPVAMPDQVTLFGQAATMVDVLANDVDPAGGMLVVQRAGARSDDQLDVAVVQGRWVRVSARQGSLTPNPQVVRYTISNGLTSGVEGEITVSQRPEVDDNSPVTQVDRVVVRAGSAISVPVLDNDFSPAGDQLRLVNHLAGEGSGTLRTADPDGTAARGDTGSAYVSGSLVRYVAPREVADAANLQVRYVAANEAGQTAPGRVEITVVPAERRNQPPEPPQLEGRAVAGDSVKLRLPGVGVDPDGDAVTLLGIGSAPELGRIVRFGADSIEYQAYPGSGGTDEFDYVVVDAGGETRHRHRAGGRRARRAAAAAAGRRRHRRRRAGPPATVDVMANDLVAGGDRVTVELAGEQPGVRLQCETGPILVDAPERADGRTVDVVYRLTQRHRHLAGHRHRCAATKDFDNPPVVHDAFGTAEDADAVTVDVLATAYDPDGSADDLTVTDVFVPVGVPPAEVVDGRITVARGDEPIVVPFRVEDADGGAATASLYVPAAGDNLPFVREGAVIEVDPGGSTRVRLADYVVDPAGGTVTIVAPDRVPASPARRRRCRGHGRNALTVEAPEGYAGPGAVVVEVTAGTAAAARTRRPRWCRSRSRSGGPGRSCAAPTSRSRSRRARPSRSRCRPTATSGPPTRPRPPGSPSTRSGTSRVDGLSAQAEGGLVARHRPARRRPRRPRRAGGLRRRQRARPDPLRRHRRSAAGDGAGPGVRHARRRDPGHRPGGVPPAGCRATRSPPCSRRPSSPVSTSTSTSSPPREVQITTGAGVSGSAQFRVVMSDVARADTGPERQAEGRITLDVLDVPDAPTAPVPGNSVVSQQVSLTWSEPDSNGAPIDYYEVRASGGPTRRCATTACEVDGLTNGRGYTFQVRAHNSVGFSDWSGSSREVTPDAKPGLVGPIRNTRIADRTLVIAWSAPASDATVDYYVVAYAGTSRKVSRTEATITGLDNNTKYQFKVYAVNDVGRGPVRTSRSMQSQGPVGIPEAPTIEDTPTSPSAATLTVTWPPVPPNGPGPVQYRVLRNGQPVPGCEILQQTLCTIPGVTYNGDLNEFKVGSSIGRDLPSFGPGKQWYAVGKPDVWGAWTVAPSGADAEARVTFTVPESRGTESTVALLVDGAVVREYDATGAQDQRVAGGRQRPSPHGRAARVQRVQPLLPVRGQAGPGLRAAALRPHPRPARRAERQPGPVGGHRRHERQRRLGAVRQRAARPVGRRARGRRTDRGERLEGHRLRQHRVDDRLDRRRRPGAQPGHQVRLDDDATPASAERLGVQAAVQRRLRGGPARLRRQRADHVRGGHLRVRGRLHGRDDARVGVLGQQPRPGPLQERGHRPLRDQRHVQHGILLPRRHRPGAVPGARRQPAPEPRVRQSVSDLPPAKGAA